jgi:hypothetical protein
MNENTIAECALIDGATNGNFYLRGRGTSAKVAMYGETDAANGAYIEMYGGDHASGAHYITFGQTNHESIRVTPSNEVFIFDAINMQGNFVSNAANASVGDSNSTLVTTALLQDEAASGSWASGGGAGHTNIFAHAKMSAATAITHGSTTKILFDTDVIDDNAFFDTADDRFEPPVNGTYQFWCSVKVEVLDTEDISRLMLRTNGVTCSQHEVVQTYPAGGEGSFLVAMTPPMALTTADYVEAFGYHESGPADVKDFGTTSASANMFIGWLVYE